jgi:hypothetical protein
MSERGGGVISRLYAFVHALLPEDWLGGAGKRFHQTTEAISNIAGQNQIRPADLAREGVELARTTLQGKANKDLAAAVRDFAEAEHTKVETELQKRSAPSEARKNEAEARLAELQVLHSEADLLEKLQKLNVALRFDEQGHLTVLPAPPGFDLKPLAQRRLLEGTTGVEQIILGTIVLDNWVYDQVAQSLRAEDFSLDAHQLIYQCMMALADAKKPIDFVTLSELLEQRGVMESVGGVAYVTSLTDGLPRLQNIKEYVDIILRIRRSRNF